MGASQEVIAERKLVGYANFKRHNPLSEKFKVCFSFSAQKSF